MGVDQSPPQAVEWFRQAAQTGYPDAVMQLGLCYLYGHGTATDEKQAAELFQQAASAGNIRAMNELGLWRRRSVIWACCTGRASA